MGGKTSLKRLGACSSPQNSRYLRINVPSFSFFSVRPSAYFSDFMCTTGCITVLLAGCALRASGETSNAHRFDRGILKKEIMRRTRVSGSVNLKPVLVKWRVRCLMGGSLMCV
jgi:hypothetical protein